MQPQEFPRIDGRSATMWTLAAFIAGSIANAAASPARAQDFQGQQTGQFGPNDGGGGGATGEHHGGGGQHCCGRGQHGGGGGGTAAGDLAGAMQMASQHHRFLQNAEIHRQATVAMMARHAQMVHAQQLEQLAALQQLQASRAALAVSRKQGKSREVAVSSPAADGRMSARREVAGDSPTQIEDVRTRIRRERAVYRRWAGEW